MSMQPRSHLHTRRKGSCRRNHLLAIAVTVAVVGCSLSSSSQQQQQQPYLWVQAACFQTTQQTSNSRNVASSVGTRYVSRRTSTPGSTAAAPATPFSTRTVATSFYRPNTRPVSTSATSKTSLSMFMGSDGGILGIGTPELATILLVGYFVLGPSELYKLTKEIGKFIQNIRTLGTDISKTFENSMESQLQLEELRKAQRELNDAFSFRRSINVDKDEEAFTTTVLTPREPTYDVPAAGATSASVNATAVAAGAEVKKRKKIRVKRLIKPQPQAEVAGQEGQEDYFSGQTVPDLEMPSQSVATAPVATVASSPATVNTINKPKIQNDPFVTEFNTPPKFTKEEEEEIQREFDQYVNLDDDDYNVVGKSNANGASWYEDTRSTGWNNPAVPATDPMAQSRFQQQLSGTWNQQILANDEKLSPLAKVMDMLAVLEEEKAAATKRLEEEFQKRTDIEERYYQRQRELLEQAAAEVQRNAFGSSSASPSNSSNEASSTKKSGSSFMV